MKSKMKGFILGVLITGILAIPIPTSSSRYIKPIFSKLDVEEDILYKEVKNSTGELEKLYLDVYQPSGDTTGNRPAIIWIHGGGFSGGDKNGGIEKNLAAEFAKMGYVTLSINYRLRKVPSIDWVGTFRDSTEDAASAVDWLVQNSKKYRVDKSHIALGGHSAGACIVTSLTYKDGEHAAWNKKSIFAVLELSGNNFWMGKADKNDPPCAIIHGTKDVTVPYNESEMIAQALKASGVNYIFHPVNEAGHDLMPNFYEVLDVSAEFLYKTLTNKDAKIKIREGVEATGKEFINIRLQSDRKYNAKQIEFKPDGKLSEWGNSEVIQLDQLKDAGNELPSKAKLSGTAMFGWNENDRSRVYFTSTIIDDFTEHTYVADSTWWSNSGLEFILDISKEGAYFPFAQWGFDANGRDIYAAADDKNVEWKLIKEGNKYIYEAAVDLSKIKPPFAESVRNYKVKSGDTLGLSIQYNKSKNGIREYQIGWTPGATCDMRNFGNITFDPSRAK